MEPNVERIPATERQSEQDRLDLHRGLSIFINSFRFSQGEPSLQQDIFKYLHILHPDWRIDPAMKRNLFRQGLQAIKRIVPTSETAGNVTSSHQVVDEDKQVPLASETRYRLNDMQDELASPMFSRRGELVARIVKVMMAKDTKFLKQGRPLSYVCHYGINAHSTGIEEYDMLFKEIRSHIFEDLKYTESSLFRAKGETRYPLYELTGLYNEHNPNDSIKLWGNS